MFTYFNRSIWKGKCLLKTFSNSAESIRFWRTELRKNQIISKLFWLSDGRKIRKIYKNILFSAHKIDILCKPDESLFTLNVRTFTSRKRIDIFWEILVFIQLLYGSWIENMTGMMFIELFHIKKKVSINKITPQHVLISLYSLTILYRLLNVNKNDTISFCGRVVSELSHQKLSQYFKQWLKLQHFIRSSLSWNRNEIKQK